MPFSTPEMRRLNIPNVSGVARALVPLICFATVEWHPVDRVMRQFGLRQCIPSTPPNFDKLHNMDMRGRGDVIWTDKHREWIALWQIRHTRLIQGELFTGTLHINSEYMQWYLRHTRRYISRESAYSSSTESFVRTIQRYTDSGSIARNPVQTLNTINYECTQMLNELEQIHPSAYSTSYEEAAPTQHFTIPDQRMHEERPQSSYQVEPSSQNFPSFSNQPQSSYQVPYTSLSFEMTPPSSFAAYANTPFSGFAYVSNLGDYRPTLPPQFPNPQDTGNRESDSSDERPPTRRVRTRGAVRTRGGRVRTRGGGTQTLGEEEPPEQPRRNQPQRRRRAPACGTGSRHNE